MVKGDHLEYSMKYTKRDALNELLLKRGGCDDILVVKNGRITDSSYTNIVLFNGVEWFTPLNPLLPGTTRNRLVSEGVIEEADIHVEDLSDYISFKLINAMLDFEQQEELGIGNIII
jgi:4-amino-4-deoxychorismate lyase